MKGFGMGVWMGVRGVGTGVREAVVWDGYEVGAEVGAEDTGP